MNINRKNDTQSIKLLSINSESDNVIFGFAGFGYTIECPMLYFTRNIASQYKIDYWGFDCNYSCNEQFLEMSDQKQNEYFENDIELIGEFIQSKKYTKKIFIGKSMGTTIMNRFMEKKIINKSDALIYLTPSREWKKIINNLENKNNKVLIIGSKGDSFFSEQDYSILKEKKNIKIIEYEKENHILETGSLKNDLKVLSYTMLTIESFIKKIV